MNMSKNLSAKYYQDNNERQQKKKASEGYQNLSKEEKENNPQYCHEQYKNLKLKNRGWLSKEKNEMRKNTLL